MNYKEMENQCKSASNCDWLINELKKCTNDSRISVKIDLGGTNFTTPIDIEVLKQQVYKTLNNHVEYIRSQVDPANS